MVWRQIQKENFTKFNDLADFLNLAKEFREQFVAKPKFPLNLPRRLAEKIKKNDLNDPILKQYIPLAEETRNVPGYVIDPVDESQFKITNKLIQKYTGRVLLLCSGACAMHCRFCFRQNFPYEPIKTGFKEEIDYIATHPDIYEVILSGGDPLSLNDQNLEKLFEQLNLIDHLTFIRFHSRFILGIPERVTDKLCNLIRNSKQRVVFVLHINHHLELDDDVLEAAKKLRDNGADLFSQTVLLNGVNDTVELLKTLFFNLCKNGFKPYYLHQFDKVAGGQHFDVEIERGKKIFTELLAQLPGYAVPKFVQEIPNKKNKTSIA